MTRVQRPAERPLPETARQRELSVAMRRLRGTWQHAFVVLCVVGCCAVALRLQNAEPSVGSEHRVTRYTETLVEDESRSARTSSLRELRRNRKAAPWIMKSLLCWRAVAAEANISWVLAGGTLLGAIRDGEVIPWGNSSS